MLVAVRQDDDVTLAGPETFLADNFDPAPAGGDDMEDDHPVRARMEETGQLVRGRRLVGPALGELGPEEDRPVEAQSAQGGVEHARRGVAARYRGVAVMVLHIRRHNHRV